MAKGLVSSQLSVGPAFALGSQRSKSQTWVAFPEELRKLALKVLMVAPITATLEVLAAWTQVNISLKWRLAKQQRVLISDDRALSLHAGGN